MADGTPYCNLLVQLIIYPDETARLPKICVCKANNSAQWHAVLAMAAGAAALLTTLSWVLQVNGLPWASTNADMQNNFSTAIAMFQGTPFQFAFLHNDPSKPISDNARLPQQALLHFQPWKVNLLVSVYCLQAIQLYLPSSAVQELAVLKAVCGKQQSTFKMSGLGFEQVLKLM